MSLFLLLLICVPQFSIDSKTGEIGVEWVNPDGGRPPVQIALREERLYYTGDLSSFREYLGYDDTVKSVVCSILIPHVHISFVLADRCINGSLARNLGFEDFFSLFGLSRYFEVVCDVAL
jgi:hypothetical protein